MTSILDEVRDSCAEIATRARFVHINEPRLAEYASSLPASFPNVASQYYPLGDPADTAAYVLTFTAINFSSGWNPHLRKLPESSGSITLMSLLRRRFETSGPIPAEELTEIRPEACAQLFEQVMEPPVDELMELFAQSWNDLGHLVCERYGGRFEPLIEAADHSAENLVGLLLEMSLFNDVSNYRGKRVPLLKRAQIASADLAAALAGSGLGRFDDLDRLTIFADNLVPHVLHLDGVLEYDSELAARIESGDLLVHGSEEEVEIRAVAVHTAERIVSVCGEQGRHINAAKLDDYLWLKGQGASYKARPRHRCRNPHY